MRRVLVSVGSGALIVALAVGSASAANPNRTYSITACYDGTSIVMTQAWSGFNVDEFTDGFGLFGEAFSFPRARAGSETSGLFNPAAVTDEPTWFGDLRFRGRVAASGQVARPTGGWTALPTC